MQKTKLPTFPVESQSSRWERDLNRATSTWLAWISKHWVGAPAVIDFGSSIFELAASQVCASLPEATPFSFLACSPEQLSQPLASDDL